MQKFGQQEKQNAIRDAEIKQAALTEATTPEVSLQQNLAADCSCGGGKCGCSS